MLPKQKANETITDSIAKCLSKWRMNNKDNCLQGAQTFWGQTFTLPAWSLMIHKQLQTLPTTTMIRQLREPMTPSGLGTSISTYVPCMNKHQINL